MKWWVFDRVQGVPREKAKVSGCERVVVKRERGSLGGVVLSRCLRKSGLKVRRGQQFRVGLWPFLVTLFQLLAVSRFCIYCAICVGLQDAASIASSLYRLYLRVTETIKRQTRRHPCLFQMMNESPAVDDLSSATSPAALRTPLHVSHPTMVIIIIGNTRQQSNAISTSSLLHNCHFGIS